ncbi:alpha/beta hydrolase [Marinomonas rhizomae]|nr:alpha/beta hydrolase [Marinomonas rhizomae]
MCDERLWEFTQQALGASLSLQHVPIPMEGSIDSIIDALAEILPQEPIHLLGFSMGGYLACAFALKYAERVKRLMVLSNTASGLLETERHQREVALNWVIKRGYKGIPKKKASAMLGPSKKEKAELIDIIFAMDSAMGEAVFVQQLKSSLDRPDLLLMIAESSFPLYFAVGSDDALLSKAVVEDMQGAKQLDVEVVEGCGHMLPLEQPTVLAELLKEFFP